MYCNLKLKTTSGKPSIFWKIRFLHPKFFRDFDSFYLRIRPSIRVIFKISEWLLTRCLLGLVCFHFHSCFCISRWLVFLSEMYRATIICKSVPCSSFLWNHNAGYGYYILFIIFGIIPFTEWFRVWVFYLSLVTVFIRLIIDFCLFSTKIIN